MHRLLERQLRKAFGEVGPPEGIQRLLEMVDTAYEAADEDRRLLERAMDLAGEELAQSNQQLAERVHELEAAQRELASADRWRRRFINAAAHQLGTPLTPLRLQVQAMRAADLDPRRLERGLDMLQRNIDRLGLLVEDLMDAAKIQGEHLVLRARPVDLALAVNKALDAMEPLAAEKAIKIRRELAHGAVVHADPGRMDQVIDNLISNAIRFTPPSGHVDVEVRHGDQVTFSVTDNGMGFDAEGRRLLFQPFASAHEDPSGVQSTGLGLYISQGLVEASGGTLDASSPGPGRGARFTVTMPAAHTASGRREAAADLAQVRQEEPEEEEEE